MKNNTSLTTQLAFAIRSKNSGVSLIDALFAARFLMNEPKERVSAYRERGVTRTVEGIRAMAGLWRIYIVATA